MILIIVIIIIIIFLAIYNHNIEHLTPNEAIANISSVYNNGMLTATNITVTDALTVNSNATISGAALIGGNATVTGNTTLAGNTFVAQEGVTTKGIMTSTIVPHLDNNLIIGSEEANVNFKEKIYKLNGNSGYGDLSGALTGPTLQQALQMCKHSAVCDRVTTDGTSYWLKNTNDWTYMTGSLDWPSNIIFTGSIYNLPNCPTGITSQEECINIATNGGKRNWIWSPSRKQCCTWSNTDNFNGSNMTTYYIKRH